MINGDKLNVYNIIHFYPKDLPGYPIGYQKGYPQKLWIKLNMGNSWTECFKWLYPKGYLVKAKKHAARIASMIKEKKGAWKDEKGNMERYKRRKRKRIKKDL